MVEMPMGKKDTRERRWVKRGSTGKGSNKCSGARIKMEGKTPIRNPHPSRSPELPHHHKTRSRCPQKLDEISHQEVLYRKRGGR
jgi:hypothetical protein